MAAYRWIAQSAYRLPWTIAVERDAGDGIQDTVHVVVMALRHQHREMRAILRARQIGIGHGRLDQHGSFDALAEALHVRTSSGALIGVRENIQRLADCEHIRRRMPANDS